MKIAPSSSSPISSFSSVNGLGSMLMIVLLSSDNGVVHAQDCLNCEPNNPFADGAPCKQFQCGNDEGMGQTWPSCTYPNKDTAGCNWWCGCNGETWTCEYKEQRAGPTTCTQIPAGGGGDVPTDMPILSGVPAPTEMPILSGVPAPTEMPILSGVPAPTEMPILSGVPAPTEMPILSGVPAPTEMPILSGVPAPTDMPILSGVPAPTEMPILSGVPAPTEMPILSGVPAPTEMPILSGVPAPTEMPILSGVPAPTEMPIDAEASCSAYEECRNLEGNCCPDDEGLRLGCCDGEPVVTPTEPEPAPTAPVVTPTAPDASCSAYEECRSLDGNCCPDDEGLRLGCCDGEPVVTPTEPEPAPTAPVVIPTAPDASCSAYEECRSLEGNCCPDDEGLRLGCCDGEPVVTPTEPEPAPTAPAPTAPVDAPIAPAPIAPAPTSPPSGGVKSIFGITATVGAVVVGLVLTLE